MSAVPEPKIVKSECTVCGCDWQKHLTGPRKKNPNLEDCVRVLKADLALAKMPTYQWTGDTNALPAGTFTWQNAAGGQYT